MNKKEILDKKVKILLSLDINNNNSKELFKKINKENSEIVEKKLIKK